MVRLPGICFALLLFVSMPFLSVTNTASAAAPGTLEAAEPCSSLLTLNLPNIRITRAEEVNAGAFATASASDIATYKATPAFCRVVATATPTTDSNIQIEVWMPIDRWNGRFRGDGNGGFAGDIGYASMAFAVTQGYATAGTDTGHTGQSTDASWALGHPEKVVDFGYRGVHMMTTTAKEVIGAYYRKPPEYSYFAACSDGGREALMEAQRYPADYDGILAGAPAYAWTNLVVSGVHKSQALMLDPASYIASAKIPAIASAVLAACDASDGLKDGILNDPRNCHFKPETLLCKAVDSNNCLTKPQVTALKALYAPTVDAKGKQVYPASLPGAEDGPGGWSTWITGSAPGKSLGFAFGTGYFGNMVYSDPQWDYKTFNVDRGLKDAISKTAAALNATEPNLSSFASRGGKLILYHGWNDPAISPLGTLNYHEQVSKTNKNAPSFVRLFMVPGMQHCYGGPGPTSFGQFGWRPGTGPDDLQHDIYLGLEEWVEKGTAPEQVTAAKIEDDGKSAVRITMTRPLCAYPKIATYKGTGSEMDAASFVCAAPSKSQR